MGHFMRCLTLAKFLDETGEFKVIFICNIDFPIELKKRLNIENFDMFNTQERTWDLFNTELDAECTIKIVEKFKLDWLIIDHYNIDQMWEKKLRPYVRKILIIDDLANRKHDCDALLDSNLLYNQDKRYLGLVPDKAKLFLGPTYFLLQSDFYKRYVTTKATTVKFNVVVNFGGSDLTNEITKVLNLIEKNQSKLLDFQFHVVGGPLNPLKDELKQRCLQLKHIYYYESAHMPTLLAKADIAIGAGGTTLIERCFMGVPTAVIIVADNQIEGTLAAEQLKLIFNLGKSENVTEVELLNFFESIVSSNEQISLIRKKCLEFKETILRQGEHPLVSMLKFE
ncbi:UDP-2,4-diacetamido-2,4,6-trideoxy-beta-L-altropyranose hydrolase [Chryseobacterium mucoviscidosis]|nr:UDP-2,4-diacetamido-2,4,6-trideoxy-beta-L-altropyranose hydrolase [Chryseobacterium mucoviscidosis]